MINLEEQIKLLVEMQALDTRIFRIEDDLTAMPETIKEMDENFKARSANLKILEDGVKELQLKRKQREGDLDAKETNVKKLQTQMYQARTNKEYNTFQEEIGRIKADNSLIEEDIIKILDQTDIEVRKVTAEKDLLKQEELKMSEEKKKMGLESGKFKVELEGLKAQRSELAVKVDRAILPKYERIVKNKDGLAVVSVANNACQGCFRILPPQVINEVKKKQDLIFCENCARILYSEE